MVRANLITAALFAGLTSATPVSPRAAAPQVSSAQAFVLVANATDPTKPLSAAVNHWLFTSVRIGATINGAVLDKASAGRVLYENGTNAHFGIATDAGTFPTGLSAPASADGPAWLILQSGPAQDGLGIRGDAPRLTGPAGTSFVVCNATDPTYGRPPYQVMLAQAGAPVQAECAPISLLPQCATLPALQQGAQYNHDSVRTVRCYKDVASIKW